MEICLLFVDIVVAVNFSHIKLHKNQQNLGKCIYCLKRLKFDEN